MRILFIGDIFGKPGRDIAKRAIPALIERDGIDFVIANVENAAAGFGITGDIAEGILGYGVDVMTTGQSRLGQEGNPRLHPAAAEAAAAGELSLRRARAAGAASARTRTGEPVGVLNLMGRIFMTPLDDPFAVALREVEALRAQGARHLRRLPCGGDVGEDRDGLASRRPRDGGLGHAHARADR